MVAYCDFSLPTGAFELWRRGHVWAINRSSSSPARPETSSAYITTLLCQGSRTAKLDIEADQMGNGGVEEMVDATKKESIRVLAMQFAYDPQTPLFADFSLSVFPGSRCLLIGANGSGDFYSFISEANLIVWSSFHICFYRILEDLNHRLNGTWLRIDGVVFWTWFERQMKELVLQSGGEVGEFLEKFIAQVGTFFCRKFGGSVGKPPPWITLDSIV